MTTGIGLAVTICWVPFIPLRSGVPVVGRYRARHVRVSNIWTANLKISRMPCLRGTFMSQWSFMRHRLKTVNCEQPFQDFYEAWSKSYSWLMGIKNCLKFQTYHAWVPDPLKCGEDVSLLCWKLSERVEMLMPHLHSLESCPVLCFVRGCLRVSVNGNHYK